MRAAVTRERITEIAVELFSTKGFHATAVADIGERAGLQPGALYYHIGSKEKLLANILMRYTEDVLRGVDHIAAGSSDPVDKLSALITFHVSMIAQHQREVAIQVRDGSALSGSRASELQALRDEVQRAWQRVLDEGLHAGRFRSADRVMVNGLLGMVNGIYMWYRPDRGDSADVIAERFIELIVNGILPE